MEGIKTSKSMNCTDQTSTKSKFDTGKQDRDNDIRSFDNLSSSKTSSNYLDGLDKELLGFDPNAIFEPIESEDDEINFS
jgi:hypothetical protein